MASGATSETRAPCSRRPVTRRSATLPPPTTTQRFPSSLTEIGYKSFPWGDSVPCEESSPPVAYSFPLHEWKGACHGLVNEVHGAAARTCARKNVLAQVFIQRLYLVRPGSSSIGEWLRAALAVLQHPHCRESGAKHKKRAALGRNWNASGSQWSAFICSLFAVKPGRSPCCSGAFSQSSSCVALNGRTIIPRRTAATRSCR